MRLKVTVDTRRDSSQLVAESKSFRFTSPWMDDTADVDDAALRSRPRSSHWPGVPADLVEPLSEALDLAMTYEDLCDHDGWINTDDLPTLDDTRRLVSAGFVREAGLLLWRRPFVHLRLNGVRWSVLLTELPEPPRDFATLDEAIAYLNRRMVLTPPAVEDSAPAPRTITVPNATITFTASPAPVIESKPTFDIVEHEQSRGVYRLVMVGADGRTIKSHWAGSCEIAAADAIRAAELWGDGYDKPTPIGWERPHAQAYPIPDRPARKAAVDAAKQWLATRGIAAESLRPVTGQIEAAFTRAINAVPGLTFRSVAVLEPGTSDAPAHLAVFFHHNWREPAAAVGLAVLSRACCDRYYNESFKATIADPERYAPTWTMEVDHVDVAPFTVYRLTGPADTAIAFAKAIEQVLSRDNVMSMFRADLAPPDMETVRDLRAAYVAAGQPFVGFVTADGITRVPPAIMAKLGNVGTTVAWAERMNGVFSMATLDTLRKLEDEGDAQAEDRAKQAAEIAELRSSLDDARQQIAALTEARWEARQDGQMQLTVPGERVVIGRYSRRDANYWLGHATTPHGSLIATIDDAKTEDLVRACIETATGVKP